MSALALVLAAATFVFWLLFAVDALGGGAGIKRLPALSADSAVPFPKVSIIVPACNEERHVESAMRSLLALDYPDYEVIAIDDRSTDRTGAILDALAAADRRLRVVRVTALPPGWLGKNHALESGARQAAGEWLLFTDGDIQFAPQALRKAMAYALSAGRDHIAAVPEAVMPTLPLRLFVAAFAVHFSMFARPWKAADPKSRRFVGIGAFNLVRAAAFKAAGGFKRIKMRPDDDLRLGKVLKEAGARQELVFAGPEIQVEWYASIGEVVQGLEKNAFSGVEYRLWMLVLSTVAILALCVWPFVAVFLTAGAARLFAAGTVALILTVLALMAPLARAPRWAGLAFPFATLFFVYVLWNSAVKALRNGGIDWRGTHYSLAELRACRG